MRVVLLVLLTCLPRGWGRGPEDSDKAEFQPFTLLSKGIIGTILSVLLKYAWALVKYGLTLPEAPGGDVVT